MVAYERNVDTNTKLRKAGIEVIDDPRFRARPRTRRIALHDLSDRARSRILRRRRCTTCRNRSFLKELDFSRDELLHLLALSEALKTAKYAGNETQRLTGKEIALIFEKTSTRTRCAFEVAAFDQGAHVTYLDPTGSQMGHKESIADTAPVLGRMFDGIEYRGSGQENVEELAEPRRRSRLQRADRTSGTRRRCSPTS